ncbi:MAG: hypothetical protein KBB54_01440 [Candidatus Pacebacteria bacterium]|nr:hypothetical protein [Candidatus Paceibacterota bacterium]MDQ5912107.1 hypothetical protein [Patescibacteria group bacterium]
MIFYTCTVFVFIYTYSFFRTKQQIQELVVRANKDLRITAQDELTEEQKGQELPHLKELKETICLDYTSKGWMFTKLFYGLSFLAYVIAPLIGLYDIHGSDFLQKGTWETMSTIHAIGILTAMTISIDALRKKYCTNKEQVKID